MRRSFEALLELEGPPLVLKADNGSCFVAELVADLLAAHQVLLLRSPPGTPAYNGSIEAGAGSIKIRAHHLAAAAGRAACWSFDDVEAARLEANEVRPGGVGRPSRAERWDARAPLASGLREELRAQLARRAAEERVRRGLDAGAELADDVAQEVQRVALAGSLRALGLLSSRTISIPARRGPRRSEARRGNPEEVSSST